MADNDVFEALVRASKACPELRLGQLIVVAVSKAGSSAIANAEIFYMPDDKLMIGLGMLMADDEAEKADQIKSYLARKVGLTLDGETVSHIAKIIRGATA